MRVLLKEAVVHRESGITRGQDLFPMVMFKMEGKYLFDIVASVGGPAAKHDSKCIY